ISGFSLIGVPFTAGFVSKYQLATAAAGAGWWWAVAVIVLTSILAIFYIGRVLLVAYFQDPPEINGQIAAKNEAPLMMLVPMWILAIASICIGVRGGVIVDASWRAAQLLIGVGA
ncbi:MAG: monovalent cation/H+ antiporter subunit D family protein, partial [Litorimonas sp.]